MYMQPCLHHQAARLALRRVFVCCGAARTATPKWPVNGIIIRVRAPDDSTTISAALVAQAGPADASPNLRGNPSLVISAHDREPPSPFLCLTVVPVMCRKRGVQIMLPMQLGTVMPDGGAASLNSSAGDTGLTNCSTP